MAKEEVGRGRCKGVKELRETEVKRLKQETVG